MCRIFRSQSVYLLDNRKYAIVLTQLAYGEHCLVHISHFRLKTDGTCYLEVCEAIDFCCSQ